MGRNREIPRHETWQVARNRIGNWVILDPHGNEPLRALDPVDRLHALYLAAQAPPLFVATQELSRVVEYLRSGYHGYTPLLEFAALTIEMARPRVEIIAQVAPYRNQGELELESAA